MNIIHENSVLHYARTFLPKFKVDAVTKYADLKGIYAVHYNPISDEWSFSDGENYSTQILYTIYKEVL